MAKKKLKDTGRPVGAPNKKSGYVRDEKLNARVTEGLKKTVAHLQEVAGYKSPSDVLHDAVQQLGYKKLEHKTHIFWLSKIQ